MGRSSSEDRVDELRPDRLTILLGIQFAKLSSCLRNDLPCEVGGSLTLALPGRSPWSQPGLSAHRRRVSEAPPGPAQVRADLSRDRQKSVQSPANARMVQLSSFNKHDQGRSNDHRESKVHRKSRMRPAGKNESNEKSCAPTKLQKKQKVLRSSRSESCEQGTSLRGAIRQLYSAIAERYSAQAR